MSRARFSAAPDPPERRAVQVPGRGIGTDVDGTVWEPGQRDLARAKDSGISIDEERTFADGSKQDLAGRLVDEAPLEELLRNDYDQALALIYDAGDVDWSQGNDLMRQATEWRMKESTLDEQLNWVESLPEGPMRGSAAGRIIEAWGSEDAIIPLQWALSMDDPGTRGSALSAAFGKWGAGAGGGDPSIGAEMIMNLEDERDQDFAINGYVSGLVWSDPETALGLAETISLPGLRAAAVERIERNIRRLQSTDHERAEP